jgi:hypothetical protein
MIRAEESGPGRVNLLGMLLGFFLVITLTATPVVVDIIKAFHSDPGTDNLGVLEPLWTFFGFVLICGGGLAWLKRDQR